MKIVLLLTLSLFSITTFSAVELLDSNGISLGNVNCNGDGAEMDAYLLSILKDKSVKEVNVSSQLLKIILNEKKDSSGSSTDSITIERSNVDVGCRFTSNI